MATHVHDKFEDVNGTLLENHARNVDTVGTGWVDSTAGSGETLGDADIQSNTARVQASSQIAIIDSGVAGTVANPIEILVEWTPQVGEDNRTLIPVRYSDNENMININAREPNGDIRLIDKQNNVSGGPYFSQSFSWTEGQTYEIKIILAGDDITVYVDDVQVGTHTMSFNNTATKHGIGNANVTIPQVFNQFAVVDEGDGWPAGGTAANEVTGTLSGGGTLEGQTAATHNVTGTLGGGGTLVGITEAPVIAPNEVTGALNGGGSLAGVTEAPVIVPNEVVGTIAGGGALVGVTEAPVIAPNEVVGAINGGGELLGVTAAPDPLVNEVTGILTGGGVLAGITEAPAVEMNTVTGLLSGGGVLAGVTEAPLFVEFPAVVETFVNFHTMKTGVYIGRADTKLEIERFRTVLSK